MTRRELRFRATDSVGDVGAVLTLPDAARSLLVFGHGAGAGMNHPFMEAAANALAAAGIGTFRYQFPYMEQGKRAPSPQPILRKTVRSAVAAAREQADDDLPLLAGGKSMGGRMTSLAAAEDPLLGVSGLVFFGFPLHAAGKPGVERGAHLTEVTVPVLFLQGTRDRLADLALLEPVVADLGARATLHRVEGADHGFHVRKRDGRTDDEVIGELARAVSAWQASLT